MTNNTQSRSRSRRHKKNKWLYLTLFFALLSSGLLVVNPVYQYTVTKKVSQELKHIDLQHIKPIEKKKKMNETKNQIDESNKEYYIAKLAIPSVKLALPVVKGVGADNLYRGAATNTENQQLGKGNYSLSSHKMPYDDDLLFSPLLRVEKEDRIYLSEGKKVYTYKVYDIFVVSPSEVKILDEIPGKTVVTLYTCETDAGSMRHVVRGELVEIKSINEMDKKIVSMLNK